MHILLKCKIFGNGQRNLRCDQTLHYRIICHIQKHGYVVGNSAVFKSAAEEISNIMLNTHCGKYNRKLFVGIFSQRSLFYNLCGKLVVWKSIS